ncbi:hypothetical protein DL93DRAFT_2173458 [Clavulina sp. PMI_390]|nr:hypothetical protein DL93DRAFT_2173458 [Clavulina sp. PMI_390]
MAAKVINANEAPDWPPLSNQRQRGLIASPPAEGPQKLLPASRFCRAPSVYKIEFSFALSSPFPQKHRLNPSRTKALAPHHRPSFSLFPMADLIIPGDEVSVPVSPFGYQKEGTVIGQYVDHLGRLILKVQFEPNNYYNAWYPTVTRIRRTRTVIHPIHTQKTIEKHVYY